MRITDLRIVSAYLSIGFFAVTAFLIKGAVGHHILIIPALIFGDMTVLCGLLFFKAVKTYAFIKKRYDYKERIQIDKKLKKKFRNNKVIFYCLFGIAALLMSGLLAYVLDMEGRLLSGTGVFVLPFTVAGIIPFIQAIKLIKKR